jgi:hypothetical protein
MRTTITSQNADNHHAALMTGAAKHVSVVIGDADHRHHQHERGAREPYLTSTPSMFAAQRSHIALPVRCPSLTVLIKSP